MTALGLALAPLAGFRFGVSGSREYVASLSAAELALVKSVVAVDSVGEGRMYIPETALGASFVGAFFPYPGYEQLNLLLQEGAHLHGIKYNTFIAGGTTDHISFLEVTRSWRDRLGNLLGCPRWLGCHRQGKRRIPAAALVALLPGKASPLVFGGKIHTAAGHRRPCLPRSRSARPCASSTTGGTSCRAGRGWPSRATSASSITRSSSACDGPARRRSTGWP